MTHLVFDAANTLIHKPDLWAKWDEVLANRGHSIDLTHLIRCHKLVSEVFRFPDVTDRDFYSEFNSEVLFSLGIPPDDELVTQLFEACSYLPWRAFDDVASLEALNASMSVISNFSSRLRDVLKSTVAIDFDNVIISEEIGTAKPDLAFYRTALAAMGEEPENVLYIGDSPRLDVHPAAALGMRACLIDRLDLYPHAPSLRITSLAQVGDLIEAMV